MTAGSRASCENAAPDAGRTRPARLQLSRAKGWRKPEGAVVVARPTRWGNPFPLKGDWIVWAAVAAGFRADAAGRREAALWYYRRWLAADAPARPEPAQGDETVLESGLAAPTGEHIRGLAAGVASTLYRISVPTPPTIEDIREKLRGRDLACWCKPGEPCHADILLELANR